VVTIKSPTTHQGLGVVKLTKAIDVLTEISNKCAHNTVLLFGSTQQEYRERR
jgi:hypothetical protein